MKKLTFMLIAVLMAVNSYAQAPLPFAQKCMLCHADKANAETITRYNWMSFSDFRLFKFKDNRPTGITDVDANNVRNDAIYNLSGQRVEKTTKGLFITNGKKVVMK